METAAATTETRNDAAANARARLMLMRRLVDVVSLPASRINAFERSVVGDLLVDMIRQATVEERRRVSQRLVPLTEIPNNVLRLLLRDEIDVAAPLLEECVSLSDHDLLTCTLCGASRHRWPDCPPSRLDAGGDQCADRAQRSGGGRAGDAEPAGVHSDHGH
ncbi:hypothetical protein [uncultured Brevundimonas sp.]|uniref:hypothetical protein n=1 Tax=uncultured Brevundimonas sp. TaxID=213418 RepID=UPI0034139F44